MLQVKLGRLGVVQLLDPFLRPPVGFSVLFRGLLHRLTQGLDLVPLLEQLPLEDLALLGEELHALGVPLVLGLQLLHLAGQRPVPGVDFRNGLFIFGLAVQLDLGFYASCCHSLPSSEVFQKIAPFPVGPEALESWRCRHRFL